MPYAGAIQMSSVIPGAASLEDQHDGSFDGLTMLAPPGVLERRYLLAEGLRVLKPDGGFVAMAPKDRGGLRLARELAAFGCAIEESARRHYRICHVKRPGVLPAPPIEGALADGGPQILPALGLWSQPGIFSWDRIDPGTALLIRHLPTLTGAGADFGCGIGLLARAVLGGPAVTQLTLIDIDRRAIAAARRNVVDVRATFAWRDVRDGDSVPAERDFVVMNPPFHDGGAEDRALGEAFIRRAAAVLKPGGVCWMVANRHLPYERALNAHFALIRLVEQADAYKVYEARR
jgi:16S rRNA (guanine1207-N2)-methyltransferase